MATSGSIEMPITLGGVRELRTQIKQLKGELINATDPKEVERLSENIGELSDKLKDANEKANVFASGSKFEQASNAMGLMRTQLMSMDFEGAGESASLFANRIRSINPAEFGTQIKGLMSVVGNLGKAFVSLGVGLLTNPIFLIAGAVTAIVVALGALLNKLGILKPILNAIGDVFRTIGDAIGWVIDQIKDFLDWLGLTNFAEQESAEKSAKAQEKRADAYEQASNKRIKAIDQAIRMEQLDGKNTVDMEIKKQELIRATARERVKALQARYKAMVLSGDYDEEEIKKLKDQLKEQRATIQSSTNEIAYIRKKDRIEKEKAEEASKNKAIETAKSEAKERADAYKKYKEDRKAIEREIQDLVIEGMAEGEAKERAQIAEKYKRLAEDVKANEKYLASERVKVLQLLAEAEKTEIEKIEQAKFEAEQQKKQALQDEVNRLEIEKKNEFLTNLETLENTYLESKLSKEEQEVNAVREKYFTLIEMARQYGEDVSVLEEAQGAEIQAIKKKYEDEEKARKQDQINKNLEITKAGLGAIGNIAEAWAGKDKERAKKAFKIQKAINIATATIDTYKGAVSAFASAGNPILGAVYAAIVVAAGLANIAKIKQTQFNDGGASGGGSPSTSVASATASTPQQQAPTFMFQGQGNNQNNLNSQNDFSGGVIKAYVSESEVTSTQKKVNKYENNSTL